MILLKFCFFGTAPGEAQVATLLVGRPGSQSAGWLSGWLGLPTSRIATSVPPTQECDLSFPTNRFATQASPQGEL